MDEIFSTVSALTNIPSPTGDTYKIADYLKNQIESIGFEVGVENKGSLYVEVEGDEKCSKRIITAHLDTLGAMVKAIKSDGRLKLALIGTFKFNAIEGENCIIHTQEGKEISGTILMHQTSVHVYSDAGTAARDENNIEIRVDEKVTCKEDIRKLGIEVGDFISFNPRTIVTKNGFIKSRHLDDKVSVAIILNLLKEYKDTGLQPSVSTIFYFSTNEEIGYGANSYIPKEVVEYVALDMGAMGDDQTTDEYTVSICAKDKSGPYHKELRNHFVMLCKENKIPYQVDIYPYYGSDASVAMKSGYDVKHGLFGAGIEASHAYERTHKESIQATYDLLKAYTLSALIK